MPRHTSFLCCLLALTTAVPTASARGARQETTNCSEVTTFETVDSLTELEGHWYILGMSERFMDDYTLTCFTWNASTSEQKAQIYELVVMKSGAHSFTKETSFYIDRLLAGTFSIRKPHWGTSLDTDVNLVGVSGNHGVVIKCRDGEKPQIVALSRRTDALNSTLSTFGLPTSLETYAALEELGHAGCEPMATEATTQTESATSTVVAIDQQILAESTTDQPNLTESTAPPQNLTDTSSDPLSSTENIPESQSLAELTSVPQNLTESTSDLQSLIESTTAPSCIIAP